MKTGLINLNCMKSEPESPDSLKPRIFHSKKKKFEDRFQPLEFCESKLIKLMSIYPVN